MDDHCVSQRREQSVHVVYYDRHWTLSKYDQQKNDDGLDGLSNAATVVTRRLGIIYFLPLMLSPTTDSSSTFFKSPKPFLDGSG